MRQKEKTLTASYGNWARASNALRKNNFTKRKKLGPTPL